MPHPDLYHDQIVRARRDLVLALQSQLRTWKKEQGEQTDAEFIARPVERVLQTLEELNSGE